MPLLILIFFLLSFVAKANSVDIFTKVPPDGFVEYWIEDPHIENKEHYANRNLVILLAIQKTLIMMNMGDIIFVPYDPHQFNEALGQPCFVLYFDPERFEGRHNNAGVSVMNLIQSRLDIVISPDNFNEMVHDSFISPYKTQN